MLELFSLKDKVAVITGASRGLGKPMAKGLAAAGAHVVLIARDEARLNVVRDEIVAAGGEATILPIDLTDEEAIRTGIRRIGHELGRVDICVNNAGIINWQPVLDSDVEDFERGHAEDLVAAPQHGREFANFAGTETRAAPVAGGTVEGGTENGNIHIG